jgi:hypothetical protein
MSVSPDYRGSYQVAEHQNGRMPRQLRCGRNLKSNPPIQHHLEHRGIGGGRLVKTTNASVKVAGGAEPHGGQFTR